MEAPGNTPAPGSTLDDDPFAVPDNCEGCGRAEIVYDPHTPGRIANRSYIRYVGLLGAFLCDGCVSRYTSWMENSHDGKVSKPEFVDRLEAART